MEALKSVTQVKRIINMSLVYIYISVNSSAQPVPNSPYGLCGRKATLNSSAFAFEIYIFDCRLLI